MKITEEVRKYAAEHGISESEALGKGLKASQVNIESVAENDLSRPITAESLPAAAPCCLHAS